MPFLVLPIEDLLEDAEELERQLDASERVLFDSGDDVKKVFPITGRDGRTTHIVLYAPLKDDGPPEAPPPPVTGG